MVKSFEMLSARIGHMFDKPLSSLAKKINISPNMITVTGSLITLAAAFMIPRSLISGGLLILFSGLFDMLDGIVARVNNRATKFGAFLDSVLDRYSDSFLLIGFSWYFFMNSSAQGCFLSIATLAGSLIISYAKARAEALGQGCNVGIIERPERIIIMAAGALTGWVMPMIWVLFVLTHITVAQRVHHVWKEMR
ncbi:MAG: archaetidylinositol phosphate synthase [Thermodesulfovibrionia bacterium]|nr:archaetidylinositol phosphate synthase [Thermodesulfovibrionia bacterium]